MRTLPIKLETGDVIHVDVNAQPVGARQLPDNQFLGGGTRGAPAGSALVEKVDNHFGHAVELVRTVAAQITQGLLAEDGPARQLSEVSMELQIGFDVRGGVFITQGG